MPRGQFDIVIAPMETSQDERACTITVDEARRIR
jgi:hypothetical protein